MSNNSTERSASAQPDREAGSTCTPGVATRVQGSADFQRTPHGSEGSASPLHHTPGPWTAHFGSQGAFSVEAPNLREDANVSTVVICQRSGHTTRSDEMMSNGHLIAAAPDLLEAMQDVVRIFSGYQGLEMSAARAAIKKAFPPKRTPE